MVPVVPVAGEEALPGALLPLVLPPMLPAPEDVPPMVLEPEGLALVPAVPPLPIEELAPVPEVPDVPELVGGQFRLDVPELALAPVGGQSAAAPEPVLPAPDAPELPMPLVPLLPAEGMVDEGMVDEGEDGLVAEGAADGLELDEPRPEPLLPVEPVLEP